MEAVFEKELIEKERCLIENIICPVWFVGLSSQSDRLEREIKIDLKSP
jgi:hypothetical protein